MVPLEKVLGSRIATRRRLAMLTQAELAERIEVTTETVSRIERGRTIPSLATLSRVAAALGCELYELLQDDKPLRRHPGALDRLLASVAHREADEIHLVADIATRIFQRYGNGRSRSHARRR